MIRVHVICEGQTEEMFVNEVLARSFDSRGIFLTPSLIGKPGHKGGNVRFDRLCKDIGHRLLGDRQAYCTTFFDFYGLPADFPGREAASGMGSMDAKADHLLQAMVTGLEARLGCEVLRRFLPYVQMYEFEGLLFSSAAAFSRGIYQPTLASALQGIRDDFETPEQINDSPHTAPSKRISALYAGYQKPVHGSLAAIEIGLAAMRQHCQRFDRWLSMLEALPPL